MNTNNLKKAPSQSLGELIAELKNKVTIEQVLDRLGLITKFGLQETGSRLQGDCPTGHPSEGHQCFSVSMDEGLYYCFHCGIGGDIVDLVAMVENLDRFRASRWIAEQFDPDMLQNFDAALANQSDAQREYNERAQLYKLVFEEGKRQLYGPAGQIALDYLIKVRGYDAAKLPETDWIYWPTEDEIRTHLLTLKPQMPDQINALDLMGAFGDGFRLALPYRDRHGMISGFLKRAHEPLGFEINGNFHRWDSTEGLKKSDLFGLHRIRKTDELLVVEGYPDAAYLPAVGIPNIVAIGQAAFSEHYIDGLKAKGIKRLIFALDNDGAGKQSTEAAVRLFSGSDIRVFVVDSRSMSPHKDPDEYVKAEGADKFKSLVKTAEIGSSWLTRRIFDKHVIASDLGREAAITECLEFADTLDIPRETVAVLKSISSVLGLSDELLAEEYKKIQEKRAAERLKGEIGKAASTAHKLIANGEPEKALRTLQKKMSEMQTDYWRAKEPGKENLDDFLLEKRGRDSQRVAGERIGYQLTDFAEIDTVLSGLQSGLYIIAADPNIGKTALMVSLMIDVLKSNEDVSCAFYSMDDSRETIVNRMLAHLTDMKINDVRFKPSGLQDEQVLDAAYSVLAGWYQQGRLEIRESTAFLTMARIQNEIQMHPNRENLVVFIDGLYNVPLDEDHGSNGSIRTENIDRANQVKMLVKLFAIPVIATAEFRKQGRDESSEGKKTRTINDIMETGKYGYNADLVILLTPKDLNNYMSQDTPIIKAVFGKNKLESFKGTMEFRFIRAKSVMQYVANSKVNS
jgi:DNA primase